ncbi:hypothetical protein ACFOLC_06340 [Lysobacter cavernae]|uniref:Lipoprotein n=1 Tax=Lysobacter cavernae TaxID=1685901 RepID=A0ABV7RR06_9GAMM
MTRTLLCTLTVLALLAGCSKPRAPDKERPVEPQATQLRDAIQAPIEQAQAAQDEAVKAAEQQREAIEAATGH